MLRARPRNSKDVSVRRSNGEFASVTTPGKIHYLQCAMEALNKRKDEDALQLGKYISSEVVKWRDIITKAGITLE